jgi:hypothetical protein
MVGIVFTLSALALHWYWLVRSLQGAQDQVTTQMRQAQQRSVAESYPNVYGLRFQPSSSKWAVVKGNLSTGTCAVDKSFTFDAGVQTVTPQSSQDFITDTTLTSPCRLAAPNGNALDQVVFFYPKGTTNSATGGSLVIVTSPPLNNRQKTVTVLPLTGKVTRSP